MVGDGVGNPHFIAELLWCGTWSGPWVLSGDGL